MRKLSVLLAFVFALSLVLAGSALAAGEQQRDTQQQQRGATDQQRQMRVSETHRASEIIGKNIENRQGESLGEIQDLVVDPSTGRVSYAVLSYGGVLGVGDKLTAVPFQALNPKPGEADKLVLNIDKERLKTAPSFESGNWPDLTDSSYTQQVDRFFQQQGRDMRESPRSSPTTR